MLVVDPGIQVLHSVCWGGGGDKRHELDGVGMFDSCLTRS